jgi:hypothetical protein
MEEKNLNPSESLNLIQSMIKQAKSAEKDNGMGWIMWGWLLFVTSTGYYFAVTLHWVYRSYIWPAFGIIAVLLLLYTFFGKLIFNKPKRVTTYTNQLVSKLGMAFFISMLVISYGNARTGVEQDGLNFGYMLILYAFWMFIFAAAFHFTLFYWGAAANWLGALVIFYFKEQLGADVLLVHSACVALGYLVPGHIAYYQFKKTTAEKK